MKRTIGEISGETKQLIEILSDCGVGQLLEYEDLASKIGLSYGSPQFRSAVQTARKSVEKEERFVFGVIRGVGLKRLNDSEIVADSKGSLRGINRKCRRARSKLECAKYEALSAVEKQIHNVNLAVAGAIEQASSVKKVREITKRLSDSKLINLAIVETLEHFK